MSNGSKHGTMRVYGSGGCGINIAQMFEEHRGATEDGFATTQISYIDTSDSNVRRGGIGAENVYLIPNAAGEIKGSGKVRSTNADTIMEHARAILQKHPPCDVNIIVGSLGGGSGSVIGPVLADALLEQGALVIAFLVGTTDSKAEVDNSIKAIKSYAGVIAKHNRPIAAYYMRNDELNSREQVNLNFSATITMLAALFSGGNDELDENDLVNWLNYNNPGLTSFPAQLATLSVLTREASPDALSGLGNVISVATLAARNESPAPLSVAPDYQAVGYADARLLKEFGKDLPAHFVLSDGGFATALGHLQQQQAQLDKQMGARVRPKSLLEGGDKTNPSGLVL